MLDSFNMLLDLPVASASEQQAYLLLLPLAMILFFAKVLSLGFKKIKLPEVLGYLVAGLLLGLIILIPNQHIFTDYTMEGINDLAKIGVILLMFMAGLETDLNKIKSVGLASIVITSLGVIMPMGFGCLISWAVLGSDIHEALFYGVILTATSVSVTVATLKELGKLDSKAGTCIVSAAILDDVIGIILLSLIITLDGGSGDVTYVSNGAWNMVITILVMISFFVLAVALAFVVRIVFRWLDKKYPHHRRIPIFAFVLCFLYSYFAQKFFQVADITGAYVAGLTLSWIGTDSRDYIDKRTETSAALFFTPIFFCSIAFQMYTGEMDFSDTTFILFGFLWVLLGLLGKFIGAGAGSLICKFSLRDSATVGTGMMARAEVVIVSAQKGVDSGIVNPAIMPFTLILILVSSLITPIILKLLNKNDNTPDDAIKEVPQEASEAQ